MITNPTDAPRAILRKKARAGNGAAHAPVAATERLVNAKQSREVAITAADTAVDKSTNIYHSAIEEPISRIGEEKTAELLETEAVSLYVTRSADDLASRSW